MIEPNQITEPNKAKPKFLDAMDEMLKNPTPQMEAFYSGLRKKGGWGQDEGGLYYKHPDGRKARELRREISVYGRCCRGKRCKQNDLL